MPVARMMRPMPGGRPDGSGGGCGGSPMNGGASCWSWVRAVLGARRQFVGRGTAGAGDQRAHLVDARVDHVHRLGDVAARRHPPTGGERGAAHEARRPDVAVDAALVAQAIHEARLAEDLVELLAVLLGHLRADLRGELRHVGAGEVATFDRDLDRLQQRVGELERAGLGDVEAVEGTEADEVEVAVDRGTGVAGQRAQLREHGRRGRRRTRGCAPPRGRRRSPSTVRARRNRRRRRRPSRAGDRAVRRGAARSSRPRGRGSHRWGSSPRRCRSCAARSSTSGGRGTARGTRRARRRTARRGRRPGSRGAWRSPRA